MQLIIFIQINNYDYIIELFFSVYILFIFLLCIKFIIILSYNILMYSWVAWRCRYGAGWSGAGLCKSSEVVPCFPRLLFFVFIVIQDNNFSSLLIFPNHLNTFWSHIPILSEFFQFPPAYIDIVYVIPNYIPASHMTIPLYIALSFLNLRS